MTTDEQVDIFLEHFGVKGMKWGKRKRRDEAARAERFSQKPYKRKMSPGTKMAIAASVAVGGAVVASMLKNSGGMKVSSLPKPKVPFDPFGPMPSFKPPVYRTAGGGIPMPPVRNFRISGSTRIKDIPKGAKLSDLSPELRSRAESALRKARNGPTPASLGIRTLTA